MPSPLVLLFLLVLTQVAVVVTRPNGYYCNIPCPLTNPCDSPYQECQRPSQNVPVTVRISYDQDSTAPSPSAIPIYNGGRSGSPTPEPVPTPPAPQPPAPQPPAPQPIPFEDKPRKSGGLLSSLLNIPGAIADTILSGEITL